MSRFKIQAENIASDLLRIAARRMTRCAYAGSFESHVQAVYTEWADEQKRCLLSTASQDAKDAHNTVGETLNLLGFKVK